MAQERERRGRRALDDAAAVHHQQLVTESGGCVDVVRDQKNS
jgi:hypothetical protein